MLEIFIHIAKPIINNTATKNIIANNTLKVPPICSNNLTIFLSANGSHIADAKWYVIVNTANLIIGIAQIPRITIMPKIPIEFFNIAVEPITVSTDSPNAFPITGTKVVVAAFNPFAVNPSILLVSPPSNDKTLIKTVIITPKNQVTPDFKNLENFPIWTFSDKLEIIPIAVAINVIGKINKVIVFPIIIIAKIIIGWIKVTDTTLPRSSHKC